MNYEQRPMNYERRRTTMTSSGGEDGGLMSITPHQSAGAAVTFTAASLIASGILGLITTKRFAKVSTSTNSQKTLQSVSRIAHSAVIGVGVIMLVKAGHHVNKHGLLTTKPAGAMDKDHQFLAGYVLSGASLLLIVSAAVSMGMYQSYKKDKTIPADRSKEQKAMFAAQIAFTVVGALSFIGSTGFVWTITHQ